MKKVIAVCGTLFLLLSAGLVYLVVDQVHLPDPSAKEQAEKTETEEQAQTDPTQQSTAELIRQGGPYDKIINTGNITLQVNGWRLTDRLEEYPGFGMLCHGNRGEHES